MKAPNGWISRDLLVWNELDRRGFVSAGFALDMPDLRHASERSLDGFYESVRQFLRTLDESTRAQIRWSVDSNYRDTLLAYKTVTDERCDPDSWAAIARNERFNRYWQAMQAGTLRREKLVLFLSKRITADPPVAAGREMLSTHYGRLLAQYREAFDQHGRIIASLFEPHGASVHPMSGDDLFRYLAIFFNPSYLRRDNYDPVGQFREEETIHQNCWHQGVQAGKAFGFFSDGFYHNLVLLKRRPQRTRRGIFCALTSLPFLDYSITVNLYPQNIRREIEGGKVAGARARRLPGGTQAFTSDLQGSEGTTHQGTGAGRCRSVPLRFRGSRLGFQRGGADFQDAPDRNRLRPDGGRPMLDEQCVLGGDHEEHLVPDLAGVGVGHLHSPRRQRAR
jgi:type IV secretion system protein TrbE